MLLVRLLIFLSFLLISCGGGSDSAPIRDKSSDFSENSVQDSAVQDSAVQDSVVQDSTSINKSISTSGEQNNIANVFGACVFGACKFE